MNLKKALVFCGILFLVFVAAFGWEVKEKYRLGNMIEGTTYISSGNLAGKVAFIDGWSVYINDMIGGGYEKLFSVANIAELKVTPRGIAYIGGGVFKGYFLLNDTGHANPDSKLFLVSGSGSLIGEVQPDFQWVRLEGMTEISSGPYQGNMACVGPGTGEWTPQTVFIFSLERDNRVIRAKLKKEIVLNWEDILLPTGITFMPADDPVYANHIVLADVGSESDQIRVFNMDGILKAKFPGIPSCEGLTYIPAGTHQGRILIADTTASGAALRSLDGSETTPLSISVGPGGVFGLQFITWLKERQEMAVISWSGTDWSIPTYLLSRPYPGTWNKDSQFNYTGFRNVQGITDLTASANYYMMGQITNTGVSPVLFGVHRLDAALEFVCGFALPLQYSGFPFRRIVYVPGATAADDRFLLTVGTSLYAFNENFNYPATIIDLSGKVIAIGPSCYDPAVKRYYMLDRMTAGTPYTRLRVFDANWDQLVEYDFSTLYARGFKTITKFTSGELKGCLALANGVDNGDNEMYFISVEYQVATDLLRKLNQEVLGSGIKAALARSLSKLLSDAIKSVENLSIDQAAAEVQSFASEVQAQRGIGISEGLASGWLKRSAEIMRGLNDL